MLEFKNTNSYIEKLSEKYKIPKAQVRILLNYAMKNVCNMIKNGEDIQLQHFGSIYFDKKSYNNYLKKKENGKNNNDPGTVR